MILKLDDLISAGFYYPKDKDNLPNFDLVCIDLPAFDLYGLALTKEKYPEGIELKKLINIIESACHERMVDIIHEERMGQDL